MQQSTSWSSFMAFSAATGCSREFVSLSLLLGREAHEYWSCSPAALSLARRLLGTPRLSRSREWSPSQVFYVKNCSSPFCLSGDRGTFSPDELSRSDLCSIGNSFNSSSAASSIREGYLRSYTSLLVCFKWLYYSRSWGRVWAFMKLFWSIRQKSFFCSRLCRLSYFYKWLLWSMVTMLGVKSCLRAISGFKGPAERRL